MISKNKILLILIIVFSTICIAFATTLIVSSVKLDCAVDHYEMKYNNSESTSHTPFASFYPRTYGCGDIDCKYCKGSENRKDYKEILYYRTYNNLKISSIVILSTFGTLLVASCVYLVIVNKKQ